MFEIVQIRNCVFVILEFIILWKRVDAVISSCVLQKHPGFKDVVGIGSIEE